MYTYLGIASVKNFQLTPVNDPENIIVQFGKVDEDRFNLDFKAPFNAFQAFSLILSQFIL
jgi:tubby-related protein 1